MRIIKSQQNSQINLDSSKTPLEKVGAFLREARQGRSLSIEDLSAKLMIGQEQLEALENGKAELLPEKVYVKAMVRRISEKLELDTKFILEELKGRELSINPIFEKKKTRKEEIEFKKFAPLLIFISGLLGLIASIPVINFMQNISPSLNPETNSTSEIEPQN